MKLPPLYEQMYNFDCKINRAVYRCEEIAASERVMGYDASAQAYEETAAEIGAARIWVQDVIRKIICEQEG